MSDELDHKIFEALAISYRIFSGVTLEKCGTPEHNLWVSRAASHKMDLMVLMAELTEEKRKKQQH